MNDNYLSAANTGANNLSPHSQLNTYSSSLSSSSATASLSHGAANSMKSQVTAPSEAGISRSPSTSNREMQKKKIGHREVRDGVVHYKKIPTDELKKSIQFGIVHFLSEQNRTQMDRDLLMQDFQIVETVQFPKTGSPTTPAHDYSDFKLKVYAPYGFRYLRRKFNVNEVDFMSALGDSELKEVSNPGASGSVFYKTSNDKYILKTVQYQECEFLKTLLAGYTLNLLQNLINQKFSLLPTIYGLYCYQKYELASFLSDRTNIRIVIMNNILPSDVPIHEKYDLKGSSHKRKASKEERAKSNPTFKDLDFLEEHPNGLMLDEKNYDNIIGSIKRDCLILESFGIMDYSLLLGIHNLEKERNNTAIEAYYEARINNPAYNNPSVNSNGSISASNRYSVSTGRSIENAFNISAVPAKNSKGDRLLLYFGIIDILQSYRFKKKLEHTLKSMITDGSKISVCRPSFYASRFIDFMTENVFKKATLKSSPSRRRPTFREPKRSIINEEPNMPLVIDSAESDFKNFKDFKPIDSVDSVSAILNPGLNLPTQSKFSNLNEHSEEEQAKSSPNQRNQHLSTSSISIRIEPHSPVKIKTTDDLIDSSSSPQVPKKNPLHSPQNQYKFNGQRSVVTVIKTPKRARAKQPEVEIVNSDTSIYSMTVPRKTNHHRPKIVLNDSTKVDSKELDKFFESASVYSSIRCQSFEQTSPNTSHLPPSYLNSVASFTIDKEQMKRNFTYL